MGVDGAKLLFQASVDRAELLGHLAAQSFQAGVDRAELLLQASVDRAELLGHLAAQSFQASVDRAELLGDFDAEAGQILRPLLDIFGELLVGGSGHGVLILDFYARLVSGMWPPFRSALREGPLLLNCL